MGDFLALAGFVAAGLLAGAVGGIATAAGLIAASIAALAIPTAAMAGPIISTPGSSEFGGAAGKGTQVTHYSNGYTDPFLGPLNCIGVHQVKTNKLTQDSFTCTSTTGLPLTGATPGGPVTLLPGYIWASDYDGAQTFNFTGTFSADGMSYTAVAIY